MSLLGTIERLAGSIGPAAFTFFGSQQTANNALELSLQQQQISAQIAQTNANNTATNQRTLYAVGAVILVALLLTRARSK